MVFFIRDTTTINIIPINITNRTKKTKYQYNEDLAIA